jgi:hypothetical protein
VEPTGAMSCGPSAALLGMCPPTRDSGVLENRAGPASELREAAPAPPFACAEGFDTFSEARTRPLPASTLTGTPTAEEVAAAVAVTPDDPTARPAEAVASGARTCSRRSSTFEAATDRRFLAGFFGRASFEGFADVSLEGLADEAEGLPPRPAGVLVGLELVGPSVTATAASRLLVAVADEATGVAVDTVVEPTSDEVGALTSAVTEAEPTFTASEAPDF